MNKNLFFLLILLISFKYSNAQLVADIQMNSINFCGVNSELVIEDITMGLIANRTWTVSGPGGFTNFSGTGINETVNLTAIGVYSVNLEVCDGAANCHDTTRTFFVNELPEAVITVNDTVACYGTEVNFSSGASIFNTPGAQFSWDNDYNTGIDEVAPSFTFLANADIVVMLEVEDDNGCVDSAFQDLYIVQNEEATFSLGNQCAGVPFELTTPSTISNSSLDSIYWYIDSTLYLNGESQTYTHPVEDSIAIILFVVNNYGCSDGMLRYIKIEDVPVLTTNITDTVICEGDELLITAGGADIYEWSNGESSDSIFVSPIENSIYSVIGTSSSGNCKSEEIEVNVNVINRPTFIYDSQNFNPTAGTPLEIEVDYNPKFAINDSLIWLQHFTTNELADTVGFDNSFVANESVAFPVELIYYKDGFRCTTTDFVKFDVDETCSTENVYIVNTFTPNGDGLNDEFVISGFNIAEITELVIYNRAGQEVFYGENLDMQNGVLKTGWNGNDKNDVRCTSGVYVYSYKLSCLNGGEVQSSGNITLVR